MRRAFVVLVLALLAAGCADLAAPRDDAAGTVRVQGLRFETEAGAFTAILFPNETPLTAAFISRLAGDGYYDGRAFGRVIPGFVIQEVDRTGGTTDQGEKVKGEFGTSVMFSAGALGIARDADPDSGSSEFFVMDFAVSTLYGNYTAFAQVVDGMDVVHAIARVPAVKTGPASSVAGAPPGSPVYFGVHDRVPVDPVQMTRVTLVEVEMSAADAAPFPLRVGETVRAESYRATLEWPADLAAGSASTLAWYVAPRSANATSSVQDPEPLDLRDATVEVEGPARATLAPTEDALARGKLTFSWTPAAPGVYAVRLVRGAEELALTNVTVP